LIARLIAGELQGNCKAALECVGNSRTSHNKGPYIINARPKLLRFINYNELTTVALYFMHPIVALLNPMFCITMWAYNLK